jgi:NhaA family Na+:H+ antiporter
VDRSARSTPTLADRLAAPFRRFLAIEAASTLLLLGATVLALVWANSRWAAGYAELWHTPLAISLGPARLELSLEAWVNDGLMVLFFFLVGMEIKHELVHGELSSRERAMLPVFGALGGMLAPAALYLAWHAGGPAAAGWGVPMATDIAFAVAALALLGPRVPSGLKVFLLALAIVDDLGAVLVIALFYSHGFSGPSLAAAAAGLLLVLALRSLGVRSFPVYWIVGGAVWLATLDSGIHATVAGVLLGFLTPTVPMLPGRSLVGRARGLFERLLDRMGDATEPAAPTAQERVRMARELREISREVVSPLERLTGALHPWSAFFVMPIFALANAGVPIEARALGDPLATRVALAVAVGLVIGKPLGIAGVSWLAVRLGLAALPTGVGWSQIVGTGVLAGIGFTMSLFVTTLAFRDPTLAAASKLGVMAASLVASAVGLALLHWTLPGEAAQGERGVGPA